MKQFPRPEQTKTIPESLNLDDYEVVGYLCGDDVDRSAGLSFDHFDWTQEIKDSSNPKNKQKFTHFLCYRDKIPTVVVGRLKT